MKPKQQCLDTPPKETKRGEGHRTSCFHTQTRIGVLTERKETNKLAHKLICYLVGLEARRGGGGPSVSDWCIASLGEKGGGERELDRPIQV